MIVRPYGRLSQTVWPYDCLTLWLSDLMIVWPYECLTLWMSDLMIVWYYLITWYLMIIWPYDRLTLCSSELMVWPYVCPVKLEILWFVHWLSGDTLWLSMLMIVLLAPPGALGRVAVWDISHPVPSTDSFECSELFYVAEPTSTTLARPDQTRPN